MKNRKLLIMLFIGMLVITGCTSTKAPLALNRDTLLIEEVMACVDEGETINFKFQFDEEGAVSGVYILTKEDIGEIDQDTVDARNEHLKTFFEENEATEFARMATVITEDKETEDRFLETVAEFLINEDTPEAILKYFEVEGTYSHMTIDNIQDVFDGTGVVCQAIE